MMSGVGPTQLTILGLQFRQLLISHQLTSQVVTMSCPPVTLGRLFALIQRLSSFNMEESLLNSLRPISNPDRVWRKSFWRFDRFDRFLVDAVFSFMKQVWKSQSMVGQSKIYNIQLERVSASSIGI